MSEHIDQHSLDNNLRNRFEYLSKFLDFTNDDIQILNELSTNIQPIIPVIVDKVYRKIFSFDITKQYICHYNSRFEKIFSTTNNSTSLFHCQEIEFRKNMLSKYLKIVFTQQEWNDSFLQYLSYVGQIHTNQMGKPSIHIDYLHIMALIGFLEHIMIDTIWKIENIDNKTKHRAIFAINKFFWIQNQFVKMHC